MKTYFCLFSFKIQDNDPILRWSGMATIAMAYCGTGNNQAVKRLLHAAVSDTNDDVRRWAVTALGFVLFKYVVYNRFLRILIGYLSLVFFPSKPLY